MNRTKGMKFVLRLENACPVIGSPHLRKLGNVRTNNITEVDALWP